MLPATLVLLQSIQNLFCLVHVFTSTLCARPWSTKKYLFPKILGGPPTTTQPRSTAPNQLHNHNVPMRARRSCPPATATHGQPHHRALRRTVMCLCARETGSASAHEREREREQCVTARARACVFARACAHGCVVCCHHTRTLMCEHRVAPAGGGGGCGEHATTNRVARTHMCRTASTRSPNIPARGDTCV